MCRKKKFKMKRGEKGVYQFLPLDQICIQVKEGL